MLPDSRKIALSRLWGVLYPMCWADHPLFLSQNSHQTENLLYIPHIWEAALIHSVNRLEVLQLTLLVILMLPAILIVPISPL